MARYGVRETIGEGRRMGERRRAMGLHLGLAVAAGALLGHGHATLTGRGPAFYAFGGAARRDLAGASLRRANLRSAKLFLAHMRHAWLQDADLQGAWLTRAVLEHADLTRANLTHAHLTLASLSDACLRGARLEGADLRSAWLGCPGAALPAADFHGASYDRKTRWPAGFDPRAHGAILVRTEGGSLSPRHRPHRNP